MDLDEQTYQERFRRVRDAHTDVDVAALADAFIEGALAYGRVNREPPNREELIRDQ